MRFRFRRCRRRDLVAENTRKACGRFVGAGFREYRRREKNVNELHARRRRSDVAAAKRGDVFQKPSW